MRRGVSADFAEDGSGDVDASGVFSVLDGDGDAVGAETVGLGVDEGTELGLGVDEGLLSTAWAAPGTPVASTAANIVEDKTKTPTLRAGGKV